MNVDTAMKSFSRHIIRYRWVWLVLIVLITAALANATRYLVVNNDYDMWLPANDKVSELYRLVDKQFSSTAVLFTVLDFSEKGVFHPDSLALVQRMTDALPLMARENKHRPDRGVFIQRYAEPQDPALFFKNPAAA